VWYAFDNQTGASTHVADTQSSGTRMPAPSGLSTRPGDWARVDLSATSAAHPSWAEPVQAYFRRLDSGWKLVGFERQPDAGTAPGR
jgi:hypothetical protein